MRPGAIARLHGHMRRDGSDAPRDRGADRIPDEQHRKDFEDRSGRRDHRHGRVQAIGFQSRARQRNN